MGSRQKHVGLRSTLAPVSSPAFRFFEIPGHGRLLSRSTNESSYLLLRFVLISRDGPSALLNLNARGNQANTFQMGTRVNDRLI